jgi:hypothetical protein
MPKNLGQKGLTNVVKIYVKILLEFVSRDKMDDKRGNMVLKWKQIVVVGCIPALAGVTAGYFWSMSRRRRCGSGRAGGKRSSWASGESWTQARARRRWHGVWADAGRAGGCIERGPGGGELLRGGVAAGAGLVGIRSGRAGTQGVEQRERAGVGYACASWWSVVLR